MAQILLNLVKPLKLNKKLKLLNKQRFSVFSNV